MKTLKVLFILCLSLLGRKIMADEKDLYDFMWLDPDKKVYVLQNKVHKKAHAVYANIGWGMGLSSTFVDTSLLHGNLGFYLNEEWALEGFYTKYSNKDNESLQNLQKINNAVPFIRKTDSNMGALVKWSPFYGKINTFNKIFYFDWSFAAGLGTLKTQSNKDTVSVSSQANRYSSESYTSVIGKTEFAFHASKNVHISIGLIMNNYKAPGPTVNNVVPTSKLRNNMDTMLTLGVSF
jgi:outer membrane beta-barrel protein